MAVANRGWAEVAQFGNITAETTVYGGTMIVKVVSGNGTATGTVNVSNQVIDGAVSLQQMHIGDAAEFSSKVADRIMIGTWGRLRRSVWATSVPNSPAPKW